ncbi:MAG: carbohydrate kinase family protein [Gemmatimonadota bacterium]|jgi:sugar/nucleoside kinase (ribokinase family)
MIWDRIHGPGEGEDPVQGWGGISYSLEALSAALPVGWVVRPILRLGADLAARALTYLESIPRVETWSGVQVASGVNPRVELRYQDRETRSEVPSGHVPPWTWPDLEDLVQELDAVYVNFITGRELNLDTARALGEGFPGPLYADLHTLFADISPSGTRFPRPLPSWREWFRTFDAIQVNEEEFRLITGSVDETWEQAAEIIGGRPSLAAVTMGPRGSAYLAEEGFDADPMTWASRRRLAAGGISTRRGSVMAASADFSADPTGCGDVWGATFFARLLAGESLERAMETANGTAFENLKHRGAQGLHRLLPDFSAGR